MLDLDSSPICTKEQFQTVEQNKSQRDKFSLMTDKQIGYCRLECELLAKHVTNFRDIIITGEEHYLSETGVPLRICVSQPYGPGASVEAAFDSLGIPKRPRPNKNKYKITRVWKLTNTEALLPRAVINMAMSAYYGGRFEISRVGHSPGAHHEYDITSAYPANMAGLPCPIHTQWEFTLQRPKLGQLYVGMIEFSHPKDTLWCGFPWRSMQHADILFPMRGRGVYWSDEIEAAEKYVGAKVKWLGGWVSIPCDQGCDAAAHVPRLFRMPKEQDDKIKGSGIWAKLELNSEYGKRAQSIGGAAYRNPIFAGLITARTGAILLQAISLAPNAVMMVATDAVYMTRRINEIELGEGIGLKLGKQLGQWEYTPHGSMFILQPGLYWFPGDDKDAVEKQKESPLKSRGVKKATLKRYQSKIKQTWDTFDLPLLLQLGWINTFPEAYISAPTFIGISLAVTRSRRLPSDKPLTKVGYWQPECDCNDKVCIHEQNGIDCDRRLISFEWNNKGYHGMPYAWINADGNAEQYVDISPMLNRRTDNC
jgi:hypothetical protein